MWFWYEPESNWNAETIVTLLIFYGGILGSTVTPNKLEGNLTMCTFYLILKRGSVWY